MAVVGFLHTAAGDPSLPQNDGIFGLTFRLDRQFDGAWDVRHQLVRV